MAAVIARSDVVWHGVVAICAPARRWRRIELSRASALRELLASTQEIIVAAYDREGFVIWKRRPGD